MIVAIHQPQFLPWLGYFNKIDTADVFVLLDNVQFKKNEWQNRNKIKTPQGWQWLTVPVQKKFGLKINQVKIASEHNWKNKHLKSLELNYQKAPYFQDYFEIVEKIYAKPWQKLLDLNTVLIKEFVRILNINTEIVTASHLEPLPEQPDDRLIALTHKLGGEIYLAGEGGKNYMQIAKYEEAGIKVVFQNFNHPVYPQLHGAFLPGMAIVDLLFNCGPDSLEIIRKAQERSL